MSLNRWVGVFLTLSPLIFVSPTPAATSGLPTTAQRAPVPSEDADKPLDTSLHIRGVVASISQPHFVRLTIGTLQNVRPDAEVVFFKDGKPIGSGQAVQVDWNDTLVAVSDEVFHHLQIGTPARVVKNPPARKGRLTLPQRRIKQESRLGLDPSSH
ncbi:MAG: hypothetical protein NZT92_11580 [Abditibacteriales bacterium]|nr:hypothetical protein [Abditibacteriales bacterium]MDW8365181.1 hypothetical protein [Abditibacteriales bacterium]